MAYGDSILTLNLYMSAVPGATANLTDLLILVAQASNSLNGDRYREYTNTSDVDSDYGAGYISATTQAQLTDIFSQTTKRPKKVLVGRVDVVGGETYLVGMDACITAGAEFYYVAAQSSTIADHESVSAGVEADGFRIFISQTVSAARTEWYGATWPASWPNFEGRERTAMVWHETDAEPQAMCFGASRGAYDPDEKSAGWAGNVASVPAPAALTSGQETNLAANEVNLGKNCTLGANWVADGKNCAGRDIEHIVSLDWFRENVKADVYTMIATMSAFGDKLTADKQGEARIASIVQSYANEGVSKGHFVEYTSATGIQYPRVTTSSDRTAKTITCNCEVYFAQRVTSITINLYGNE